MLCRKKEREKEKPTGGGGGGEVEPKASEVSEESPGLLPPDPALWAHLTHADTQIQPLSSTRSQVTELARLVPSRALHNCVAVLTLGALIYLVKLLLQLIPTLSRYVSDSMGGVVSKTGTLGFELPAAQVQLNQQSNLLPLGEVTEGSFQHRALLFKVSSM